MLRFQVLTLFPELFQNFIQHGLINRAVESRAVSVEPIQLRDYAVNKQGQVDDTPYGGGSGMVLRPDAAFPALEAAKAADPNALVILPSPRGKQFSQKLAHELIAGCQARNGGLIFLCPRYEGVDQRVIDECVDLEISIGDYILMGGESAAQVMIESLARLLPGVLGNPESTTGESFESGLLEYPQYTKPQVFKDQAVPEILLSGHHENISAWRRERAVEVTVERRPDLIAEAPVTCDVSIALIHHPVRDKRGDTITSSITNIDVHDIARTAKTFGLSTYYVVHPTKTLRRLVTKICDHWAGGFGLRYNPNRTEALEVVSVVTDLDDAIMNVETRTGMLPVIVTTSAQPGKSVMTPAELRARMRTDKRPHLILLGTGWGLHQAIMDRADIQLEPILGPTDYNHLSVRSAAAITLDRLFHRKYEGT